MLEATPIALYSEPRFAFTSAFGEHTQLFALVFRVDRWSGTLATSTDEITHAGIFALDDLPESLPALYLETLEDLRRYEQLRQFILN